ncbi:Variant surface glycoprotein [Trypanosoma congolense IL3000]|uniref:Variant surface glycoprotein n=1 Tax=Trypanosoma congolense (strain IL3000) TaxID=1068625 RepID=F9WD35_TRYCI|nr:Variant surface glycoprotein [Trypanosoma congolense IL3000]
MVIMRMKVLMVIMLIIGVVRANEGGSDHNGKAHKALCDVLKVAVRDWEEVQKRESMDPLRKALGRTIFGSQDGGKVDGLKGRFPKDYEEVKGSLSARYFWCGERHEGSVLSVGKPPRWSGHSGPHDLVCLCTIGKDGWPLNDGKVKLCGQSKDTSIGGTKGWSTGGSGQGKEKITDTWGKVVTPCLVLGEVGETLKRVLKTFKDIINKTITKDGKNGYLLGERGGSEYPCSGNEEACVMYYNDTKTTGEQYHVPWWVELEYAIKKEEQKEQKKREDEKRKQEEKNHQKPKHQKQSQQHQDAPRKAALRSSTTKTTETEQGNPENISAPLAAIEDTSGTRMTQPLWLISTAFFM